MSKVLYGLLLLICLIALALLVNQRLQDKEVELHAAVVVRGAVNAYVSSAGAVINKEELTLSSPISGQLLAVRVNEGDEVRTGQLLASFDAREFSVALEKAASILKATEQSAEFAARDWAHLLRVYQIGGESRKTVEDAELRYVNLSKERVMAEQSLRQARLDLDKLKLNAPRHSIVTAHVARVGTWVRAGDPLFKLAPVGTREIEIKLDAGDSTTAVVGKAVTVSSEAYLGQDWQEKITWVAPSTNKDGAANTLAVRISLGSAAPRLALGQQVDVRLTSASVNNALQLPTNAIISKQGQPMVAVLDNGRIHLKPITTGIESVNSTEIKSGLTLSEKVALPEGRALREGDRAKFVDKSSDAVP